MSNSQSSQGAFVAYPISTPYPTVATESSQSNSQPAVATSSTSQPAPSQSRQAAEEARKDRTLAEFLLMLDEYEPLVRTPLSYTIGLYLIPETLDSK